MYTLTAAAAALLNTDHRRVVLYAVIGVIWGWAVAGIAFLPYAVYLLLIGSPWVYLPAGVVSLVGTLLPMVGFDRLFYGKWTVRCCSSSSVMTPRSESPSIGCSGEAALPVLARKMYMEAHGRAAVHFKFRGTSNFTAYIATRACRRSAWRLSTYTALVKFAKRH